MNNKLAETLKVTNAFTFVCTKMPSKWIFMQVEVGLDK